jgi:hypothetical protein
LSADHARREEPPGGRWEDPPGGGGRHPLGCFYGGPKGEAYWFSVVGCELDHTGDIPALVGTQGGAQAAWEHLVAAGLLRTDESG